MIPNILGVTVHPHLIKWSKKKSKFKMMNLLTRWGTCGTWSIGWEHLLHSILMSQETLFKICCYLNSINDLFPLLCSILFLNVVHPNLPKEGCLNLNERNCSKKNRTNSSKFEQYFSIKLIDPLNVPSFYRLRMWCVILSSPYFMWYLKKIKVL